MMNDNEGLSVAERAVFNTKLDLGRIYVALETIINIRHDRSFPDGYTWIVFMHDKYYRQLEENMRLVSFHDDVYDDLYSIVHHKNYRDVRVVLESDLPDGDIWKLFSDTMVAMVYMSDQDIATSWASSGRNVMQINFMGNVEDPRIMHTHDCDTYATFYEEMSKEEYSENTFNRYKSDFVIGLSTLWECERCGYAIHDSNVELAEIIRKRLNHD
jgi:hypothetical protein